MIGSESGSTEFVPTPRGTCTSTRRPYFSVVVRGGTGETVDPAGTVLRSFDLTPGSVLWYGDDDVPDTHAFRNTGEQEVIIITTEIL